jgi:hypothetical protein
LLKGTSGLSGKPPTKVGLQREVTGSFRIQRRSAGESDEEATLASRPIADAHRKQSTVVCVFYLAKILAKKIKIKNNNAKYTIYFE